MFYYQCFRARSVTTKAKSLNFDPFIHTEALSQLINKARSQVFNKRR